MSRVYAGTSIVNVSCSEPAVIVLSVHDKDLFVQRFE